MQTTMFDSVSEQRFKEFHSKNPQVYTSLVKLAKELKGRGHRKIGIKMLFEVVRWQTMLKTEGDQFKLNNNYHSRYARMIMDNEPDLDSIFELRELRS